MLGERRRSVSGPSTSTPSWPPSTWRSPIRHARISPRPPTRSFERCSCPTRRTPALPRNGFMLARVLSCTTQGIQGLFVEVEADLGAGLPTFSIVGLPDAAVRESRERVLAALRNCGFEFPARKITVNLAPAHVRKEGARFDLPIAVALLRASGQIPGGPPVDEGLFVGELALDGAVRPVRGVLAVLAAARREGRGPVWIPGENAAEARAYPVVRTVAIRSLSDLRGDSESREDVDARRGADHDGDEAPAAAGAESTGAAEPPDLAEVRGQLHARRAL